MKAVHKIGVAQLKVGPCKAANLEIVERLAAEAKGKGCEMLFLPENADFIGQGKEETFALSEKMDGETVGTFKNIAKKHNLWINVGSFHEVLEDDTKIGNTQLMLNAEGDVLELYRKAHLFDVDVPGGRSYRESASTVGGSSYKTADTPVGRVGMTTCYDLRFPYMYSELAFRAHSDIITVPSAFMVPTGKVHWEVLLRARAIETQTFIIAAAQAGAHNPTRSSYGHSLVVDPWGTVLLDMGDEENTLGVAILDFSTLHNTRERLPVAQHIKPLTWPSGAPPPLPGSHTEIKQREVQNPEAMKRVMLLFAVCTVTSHAMAILSFLDLSGTATNLDLHDASFTLYVSMGTRGFSMIDATLPSFMVEIARSTVPQGGATYSTKQLNSKLAISTEGDAGVYVWDIRQPGTVTAQGFFDVGTVSPVKYQAICSSVIYSVTEGGVLYIFDVAGNSMNVFTAGPVAGTPVGDSVKAIACHGTTLHVVVDTRVDIYDVSAPLSITKTQSIDLICIGVSIALHLSYAFVACSASVIVAQIGTARKTTLALSPAINSVTVSDNMLFVSSSNGLGVYDVLVPGQPKKIVQLNNLGNVLKTVVDPFSVFVLSTSKLYALTAPPPLTSAPSTPVPPTPAPPTRAPTLSPLTPAPPTVSPLTAAPPTGSPSTLAPPTPVPQTQSPSTSTPPTVSPSTPAPPTLNPSTIAPQTPSPLTFAPPTLSPSTPAPQTPSPSTPAPPTLSPATVSPSTPAPPTMSPATVSPSTPAPPTLSPLTLVPTTPSPLSLAPPTLSPATLVPTVSPSTLAPPTLSPSTIAPPTQSPLTLAPPTLSPPTLVSTVSPSTPAPPTLSPLTLVPTTPSPLSLAPPTLSPSTIAPLTPSPSTPAPPTVSPSTHAPRTLTPSTPAPTLNPSTPAPPTLSPVQLTSAPPLTPTPPTSISPSTGPTAVPPTTTHPSFSPLTLVPRTVTPAQTQIPAWPTSPAPTAPSKSPRTMVGTPIPSSCALSVAGGVLNVTAADVRQGITLWLVLMGCAWTDGVSIGAGVDFATDRPTDIRGWAACSRDSLFVESRKINSTVLKVRVGPTSDYKNKHNEVIRAMVNQSRVAGMKSDADLVVLCVQKERAVSDTVLEAVRGMEGTTAFFPSLSSATQAGKTNALLHLLECPIEFDSADLSFTENPLTLKLHSFDSPSHAGAAVGNMLLVSAFIVIHYFVVWALFAFSNRSWLRAAARCRFPSFSVFPAVFLYQPTLASAVYLLLNGEMKSKAIGVCTIALYNIPVVLLVVIVTSNRVFCAEYMFSPAPTTLSERVMMWILGKGQYVSAKDPTFVDRYALLFQDFFPEKRRFLLVELAFITIFGVIDGVESRSMQSCKTRVIITLIAYVAYTGLVTKKRAYTGLLNNIACIGAAVCQTIAAFFIVVHFWSADEASFTSNGAVIMLMIAIMLTLFKSAVEVFGMFHSIETGNKHKQPEDNEVEMVSASPSQSQHSEDQRLFSAVSVSLSPSRETESFNLSTSSSFRRQPQRYLSVNSPPTRSNTMPTAPRRRAASPQVVSLTPLQKHLI